MAEREIPSPSRLHLLEEELQQREYEIALLRETAMAIGSELDLDKVLQLVAERARQLINADTVLIPILNWDCDEYTYQAGSGRNVEEIVGESLPLDFGVCGWVWRHKRPWWRGVLDELSPQERNRWEKEAGTLILVPLLGREHFLGGIAGMNKANGEEFSQRDLHLLELFAGQVAIAIENAMAMHKVQEAREQAERFQNELQRLNKQLVAINQEMEHLALYDQLTGLPNRSLIMDRLRHELSQAASTQAPLSVLLLDLDRFQDINDTLGHETGDQLIRAVAERLVDVDGPASSLGRLGGDEFALILPGLGETQAIERALHIQEILRQAFSLAGEEHFIQASIGLAHYPQHGEDEAALLKHAEAAMYAAKREKTGIQAYNESHDAFNSGRLALVRDLQAALDQDAFQLHYQPKIALPGGAVVGVEALARWPHAERGYVPPDMFISALEQTGLIHSFTHWVLSVAAEQLQAWRQCGWDIGIAVNVPIMALFEPGFMNVLSRLAEQHGNLQGLTFEITETLFLSDYDRFGTLLEEIRRHGVAFSIDDFGTGHSSLSRLRRLPVTELKIDRSFVTGMEENKDDLIIVKSTIDLAHNLGIQVVAEGVETASALERLAGMGCDYAQGYHISRPLPGPEFEAFYRRGHHRGSRSSRSHAKGSG
jgi:diguanylate cyclase (GGDEF)-like protein